MSVELLSVVAIKAAALMASQEVWAHDDGDWLLIRRIKLDTESGIVTVMREDWSQAEFNGEKNVLVKVS